VLMHPRPAGDAVRRADRERDFADRTVSREGLSDTASNGPLPRSAICSYSASARRNAASSMFSRLDE
jgi:hypothetical protein